MLDEGSGEVAHCSHGTFRRSTHGGGRDALRRSRSAAAIGSPMPLSSMSSFTVAPTAATAAAAPAAAVSAVNAHRAARSTTRDGRTSVWLAGGLR